MSDRIHTHLYLDGREVARAVVKMTRECYRVEASEAAQARLERRGVSLAYPFGRVVPVAREVRMNSLEAELQGIAGERV